MTISSVTNRVSYLGNGVTTSFSFPYSVLLAGDLKVYQNGVLKTLTTHYTLSGTAPYTGGTNVQFVVAPPADDEIVILRDPPITQLTDPVENDPLPVEAALETPLDKLTMIAQRLSDRMDRSVRLPDGEAGSPNMEVPALETRANKVFVFSATGTPSVADLTGSFVTFSPDIQLFSGDGAETDFVLSEAPGAAAALIVAIDGVLQKPGTDFTASGVTLTFTTAPAAGASNIAVQNFGIARAVNTMDADGVVYTPAGSGAVNTDVQTVLRDIIRVDDFAVGDGVTDDTAGLMAASVELEAARGGILRFGKNKTYKIWPSGSGLTIFDLAGITGTIIEGNGAKILAGNVNASNPYCFHFDGGERIQIRDLEFDSAYTALDSINGPTWMAFKNGTKNISIFNIKASHGRRGIECQGWGDGNGTDDFAGRVKGIHILGYHCDTVYYPLICEASGDDLFARGFTTRNCGRSYFPFNVENHDVWLDSAQGGIFSDCLLKGYGSVAAGHVASSGLRNIKLNYSTEGRYAGSGDSNGAEGFIAIECQRYPNNPGPVQLDNIDITLRVNVLNASDQPYHAVVLRKFDENGNIDSTTRGHVVNNLTIRGTILAWDNAQVAAAIDLFSLTGGMSWAGETSKNVVLEDLEISGGASSVVVNGQPWANTAPALTMRNVVASGTFGENNVTVGTPFTESNVFFSNRTAYDVRPTAFTPTWASAGTQPALGNGTLTGQYERRGKRVTATLQLVAGTTTTFGTGAWSFSLPFAGGANHYIGQARLADSSTGVNQIAMTLLTSSGSTVSLISEGSNVSVDLNTPFVWATGDSATITITYLTA